jgi:hypothetical protein
MHEVDILTELVDKVQAATPSDVDVRLEGGDQDVNIPEAILSWSAEREPDYAGHRPQTDILRDQQGNAVGIEDHMYFTMSVEVLLRFYDEIQKDQVANDIHFAFAPYERAPDMFDADTFGWQVGNVEPRGNPVMEPDWYVSAVRMTFGYIKRKEAPPETVPGYIENIEIDVYVDETLSE